MEERHVSIIFVKEYKNFISAFERKSKEDYVLNVSKIIKDKFNTKFIVPNKVQSFLLNYEIKKLLDKAINIKNKKYTRVVYLNSNLSASIIMNTMAFVDEEYTIVGYEEGNGNLAGMIGALIFESRQGDKFTASVNGGWIYLKELWDQKDSLIGKQATIKYFNLTPDGKPRFPKVTAIRDYE